MENIDIQSKIDALFEHYTQPGSPGCALAVIQDDNIIYQQGYGLANLELNVPITPTSAFNICQQPTHTTL